jgi:acyl-CoA carboxylase epsilon subunit
VADGQDQAATNVPFLRVVRGDATPEEIAAIVATLAAVAAARSRRPDEAKHESVRTNWNDRARLLRAPVHPAPGAWRGSALP